jgi:hypothetical protein
VCDVTVKAGETPTGEVKAPEKTTLYHGSDAADLIRAEGFKLGKESNRNVGAPTNVDRLGQGIYFAENPKDASRYARSWDTKDVVEAEVKPGVQIKKFSNYQEWYDYVKDRNIKALKNPKLLNKLFEKEGYGGVNLAGDIVVFKTKDIQIKGQETKTVKTKPASEKTVREIEKKIKESFPINTFELSSSDRGGVFLDWLAIPHAARGKGTGTKVMKAFVKMLDQKGLRAELVISSEEPWGHEVERLQKFYDRFGFKEPNGKTVKTTGNLVREPVKKAVKAVKKTTKKASLSSQAKGKTIEEPPKFVKGVKPPGVWFTIPELKAKIPEKYKEELTPYYDKAEEARMDVDQAAVDATKGTDAEVHGAPIKGPGRIIEKTTADYKGDFTKVKDWVRNTITVNRLSDADILVENLKDKVIGNPNDKNFLKDGNTAGYHQIILTVPGKNGLMGEIQIATPKSFEAKIKFGDKLYDQVRTIDAKEKLGEMTPAEDALRTKLNKEMKALYDKAWAEDVKDMEASAAKEKAGKEAEQLQSRVWERMKAENPNLEGDLGYDPIKLKEESKKNSDLVLKDKQRAFDIAMGKEVSPDFTSTGANIALAEQAGLSGDYALEARLIKARSLAQTRRGQEIVMERGSVTDNSASKYIKELVAARLETVGKGYLSDLKNRKVSDKMKGTQKIESEVAKLENRIKTKKLDVKEALALLDKMTCL